MSDTLERVKSIVAERLDTAKEEITPESSFMDDLEADSLDTVELVMAFEEEFGIEISDDESNNIRTVEDAVKFIDNALSEPS